MGGGGAGCERIPEAVYAKIFQFLPRVHVARVCALVCRSWRDMASEPLLWMHFCEGTGLSPADSLRCLGGWRALYGVVFGQNLVASPHFERVLHMDADALKNEAPGPWHPKHRLLLDRLSSMDDNPDDHHGFGHWAVEGGSVFQRGAGDGVIRECPPLGSPPCPISSYKPVVATSYEWGKVQQYIGLQSFSNKFLDSSPPLICSAWYSGRQGMKSKFRIQLYLRDELKNSLAIWDSGELLTSEGQWKEAKRIIRNYPVGVRSIIIKLAGTSILPKSGFHGAKFTAIKLQFLPEAEAKHYDIEEFGSISVHGWQC